MDPVLNIILIVLIGLVAIVVGALVLVWLARRGRPDDIERLSQITPPDEVLAQPQAPPAPSPTQTGGVGYRPLDEMRVDSAKAEKKKEEAGPPPAPRRPSRERAARESEAGQDADGFGMIGGDPESPADAPAPTTSTGSFSPAESAPESAPEPAPEPKADAPSGRGGDVPEPIVVAELADLTPEDQPVDEDLLDLVREEAEELAAAPEPKLASTEDLPDWLAESELEPADDFDWLAEEAEEAEEMIAGEKPTTAPAAPPQPADAQPPDDPLDWMLDPTPEPAPPSRDVDSRPAPGSPGTSGRLERGVRRRAEADEPTIVGVDAKGDRIEVSTDKAYGGAPAAQPAAEEQPAAGSRRRQTAAEHIDTSGVNAWAKLVAALAEYLQLELASASTPLRTETAKRIFLEGMFATALLDAGVTLARGERQRLAEEVIARVLGSPATPAPVQFSAHYPRQVRPGEWQPLYAYLFREWAAKAVQTDVQAQLGPRTDSYAASRRQARQTVQQGTLITATPHLPGFQFNPPSASVGFYEDWHRFDFKLRAVDAALDSSHVGFVTFTVEGVIVADVPLLITVSRAAADSEVVEQAAKPYQAIFCSYSHQDTRIVERVEAAVKTLGHDYLRDATTLRSGQDWNEALMRLIERADIFQLFWSEHSAASRYVEQEWRHALTLIARQAKDSHFIRPVRWVDPPTPLPPPELGHIHFAYQPELGQ